MLWIIQDHLKVLWRLLMVYVFHQKLQSLLQRPSGYILNVNNIDRRIKVIKASRANVNSLYRWNLGDIYVFYE